MIRVRFPNGQCLQYNDATGHRSSADGTEIIRRQGDDSFWVAFIPKATGCLIEHVLPCAVTNPIAREMTPESALELVTKHLRTLPSWKIRDLKSQLRAFDSRSNVWNP